MKKIAEIFSESQLKTLEQDIPTPLYYRLYTLLKNAILDGTIDNGAQMPTEQQLADTFGVLASPEGGEGLVPNKLSNAWAIPAPIPATGLPPQQPSAALSGLAVLACPAEPM